MDDELEGVSIDDPVEEVHEFMLIDGEGEGIADGPAHAVAVIEMRKISIKNMNVKSLKEVAALLKLPSTGRKDVLFCRIRDSQHVKKLSPRRQDS